MMWSVLPLKYLIALLAEHVSSDHMVLLKETVFGVKNTSVSHAYARHTWSLASEGNRARVSILDLWRDDGHHGVALGCAASGAKSYLTLPAVGGAIQTKAMPGALARTIGPLGRPLPFTSLAKSTARPRRPWCA